MSDKTRVKVTDRRESGSKPPTRKTEGGEFEPKVDDLGTVLDGIPSRPSDSLITQTELEQQAAFSDSDSGTRSSTSSTGERPELEDIPLPKGLSQQQLEICQAQGIKGAQLKGVSLKHCEFARFSDKTKVGDKVKLGKGACNTVFTVKYGDLVQVFKEEKTFDDDPCADATDIGIPADEPRYGNRNIGSSVIGELLGTKVVSPCRFGICDGKVGLLMDKAPGKCTGDELKEPKPKRGGVGSGTSVKPPPSKFRTLKGKALASLQKQLSEMECCDILTGQADRHDLNYMIHIDGETVTVTAIDNDVAFPSCEQKEIPLHQNSVSNMPKLIGSDTAKRIMEFNVEEAKKSLADLLSEAEVKNFIIRLTALQEHVKKLAAAKCIVEDWESWVGPDGETATEYLQGEDVESVFGRDFGEFYK